MKSQEDDMNDMLAQYYVDGTSVHGKSVEDLNPYLMPDPDYGDPGEFYTLNGAQIHRLANIVGDVIVGPGSRIDAYCTITGHVRIGKNTHIATGCCIFGGGGVFIGDYVGLSGGTKIYSATEDVSGDWITNPTVSDEFRNPHKAEIHIEDHCVMGAGSIIFPGGFMPEGAYLGALSMCKEALLPWSINVGVPSRMVRRRSRGALAKAKAWEAR